MKIPVYGLGLVFGVTMAIAANPASTAPATSNPEWRGVMDLGGGKKFLIALPGGATSAWEKVGDSFGDWKVAEYREKDRTLVLQRGNGARLDLMLLASPAGAASPVVPISADGEAIGYLRMRAGQLRQQAEDADKALAAFKEKNGGLDPSQMAPGAAADEGNSLKTRAAVARSNYMDILNRIGEAQHGEAGITGTQPTK